MKHSDDRQTDLFLFLTLKERTLKAMQRFMDRNAPAQPTPEEKKPANEQRTAEQQERLDRLAKASCHWVINGFKGPQPR